MDLSSTLEARQSGTGLPTADSGLRCGRRPPALFISPHLEASLHRPSATLLHRQRSVLPLRKKEGDQLPAPHCPQLMLAKSVSRRTRSRRNHCQSSSLLSTVAPAVNHDHSNHGFKSKIKNTLMECCFSDGIKATLTLLTTLTFSTRRAAAAGWLSIYA